MGTIEGVMGIDLGTTFSCVAVIKNDAVCVVANSNGNHTTPSCVNFHGDAELVGDNDKTKGTTIYDQKRLIGRKFFDPEIQKRLKYWPFKVIDKNGKPVNVVTENNNTKHYCPEEISAKLLSYLKEIASSYMGFEINHAVVTVPAYFNISQREATKDACRIAGLNVLRIINEPTAAAYSIYGTETVREDPYNILVYDLGGGTFDVSILRVDSTSMKVLATRGDNNLGGEDFNNRMVAHFAADIQKKFQIDIFGKDGTKHLRRLQNACEKMKKNLSLATMASAELSAINGQDDYDAQITRAKFEELNHELFWKTTEIIDLCLSDANLHKDHIEVVVLVGGSTRIPLVHTLLKDFFKRSGKNNINNIELKNSQNPDESIAIGAAMYANKLAMAANILNPPIEKELIDVTPLSLGIEVAGGKMSVIIARNTPIPKSEKKIYTNHDFQTTLQISVYQGECPLVKDNYDLGSFTLSGIPSKPKGTLDIEVAFNVNEDGVLDVSAVEVLSKIQNKLELKINGRLNETEIEEMINAAQLLRQKLLKDKEIANLKNKLEEICLNVLTKLKNCTLDAEIKEEIEETCTGYTQDIKSKKTMTQVQLERKIKNVNDICIKNNIL